MLEYILLVLPVLAFVFAIIYVAHMFKKLATEPNTETDWKVSFSKNRWFSFKHKKNNPSDDDKNSGKN